MHGEREATKEQVFRNVTATCIRDLRQADAAALFMVSIPLVLNLTRRPAGHRQGNGTTGILPGATAIRSRKKGGDGTCIFRVTGGWRQPEPHIQ